MAIDTVIAEPLSNLPPDHLHHLVTADAPPMPPQLSVRTCAWRRDGITHR